MLGIISCKYYINIYDFIKTATILYNLNEKSLSYFSGKHILSLVLFTMTSLFPLALKAVQYLVNNRVHHVIGTSTVIRPLY